MEDIRPYRIEDEPREPRKLRDDDRRDRGTWWESQPDDEVPFHIPRD